MIHLRPMEEEQQQQTNQWGEITKNQGRNKCYRNNNKMHLHLQLIYSFISL